MNSFDPTDPHGFAPQQLAPVGGETVPHELARKQPSPAGGFDATRRPGAVTAAAVYAFIAAAVQVPAALLAFFLASRGRELFGPPGLGYGYGVVNLAFMVLLVWGGIAALRGKTNKILVYTALVLAALQIVQTVLTVVKHYGSPISTVLGLLLALLVIASLTTARSRAFFIARGGTTTQRRPVVITGIVLAVIASVVATLVAINSKPNQPTRRKPQQTRYQPAPTYRAPTPTHRLPPPTRLPRPAPSP